MGNIPPSKDIIPMPDEELYLSLLQEGFIIAEHVFDSEQQNGVRITISNFKLCMKKCEIVNSRD